MRRKVEAVVAILKKRFGNLSTEEVNKLAFDIVEALDEIEKKL